MIIKLTSRLQDLSYFICKHPNNKFEKEIGSNRKILGRFIPHDEHPTDIKIYKVELFEDSLEFLKSAKQKNLNFYLNSELNCVCPYNLKCMDEVFRSILRCKNTSPEIISDDLFNLKNMDISCVMGPFIQDEEYIRECFSHYNMDVTPIEKMNVAGMYRFNSLQPITVSEFLQKIYVLSLFVSFNRYSLYNVDDNVIEKITLLSKNWLYTSEFHKRIINKFCYNKPKLKEIFIKNKLEVLDDHTPMEYATCSEKVEVFNKKLNNLSLHEKRHNLLIKTLQDKGIKINSVVDFCTSEGKLLEKLSKAFPEASVLGIEKSYQKISQYMKELKSSYNHRVIETNIIYPNITESDTLPDLLTCVEAIEHFNKDNRLRLLKMITEVFVPKYLYLTTPNVEYNYIYGLDGNEYRRNDHIIEYTEQQFDEEVLSILKTQYNVEFLNILTTDESKDSNYLQPSFCIFCTHKSVLDNVEMIEISKPFPKKEGETEERVFTQSVYKSEWDAERILEWQTNLDFRKIYNQRFPRKVNFKFLRKLREYHGNIFLPSTGYVIKENELNSGYTSDAFIKNGPNIFYLGPNIAPAEYYVYNGQPYELTSNSPNIYPVLRYMSKLYVEHPTSAFEYYAKRGIYKLIEQKKYMGSRGYILAFKTIENAIEMGFNQKIIINSRAGFPFFDLDPDLMERIHSDIVKFMENYKTPMDYLMIDCEILPWSYKASGLIKEQFEAPIESAILSRKYKDKDVSEEHSILETLHHFTKGETIEIYPFHVLCCGETKNGKTNHTHGYFMNNYNMMVMLEDLCNMSENDVFKKCEYRIVNTNSFVDTAESIFRWNSFSGFNPLQDSSEYNELIKHCNYYIDNKDTTYNNCDGEGFVYKPFNFMNYTKAGYYIQPALKVRGYKYLNLIYGIDLYKDPEYFKLVTNRSVNKKRSLAAQQFEVSKLMIDAFSHNRQEQRLKHVAAFIGMENINSNIDKTL